MKTGFYMDEEGCLWLLSPGKKLSFYSDWSNDWREWTGSYENGLSWIVPEAKADYIGTGE
jgi:hypothetical protein